MDEIEFVEVFSESGEKTLHYNVFFDHIEEEHKSILERELNETDENKLNGIQNLKDFLKKELIPCPDNSVLIWILRGCKYNIRKAEKKLVKFLEIRNLILEKVSKIDEDKIKAILDDLVFGVLPYTDRNGNVILFTTPNVNLDAYSMEDVIFCFGALLLCLLTYPITAVCSMSFIFECKTPSLSVYYPITKAYIRYVPYAFSFPVRFKKLDFLNENFLIRWCYNILRVVFSLKLRKRVSFHGNDYKELLNHYHPDILPGDFNGTLGSLNNKCYKQRFLNFIEEIKRGKKQ